MGDWDILKYSQVCEISKYFRRSGILKPVHQPGYKPKNGPAVGTAREWGYLLGVGGRGLKGDLRLPVHDICM